MIELQKDQRHIVISLCKDLHEVPIHCVLEGAMGQVWVPELDNPAYCLIQLGDLVYVLGIPPKSIESLNLRDQILESCNHCLVIPANEWWGEWMEYHFPGEYRLVSRYAMKKDEYHFDPEELGAFIKQLPDGIKIKRIDERLYKLILKEEWSKDFCSNYNSAEHFLEAGLGFVAMQGKKIVAGCSSYGSSKDMMEIQVDTREEYRRQGLAMACCAQFILECLKDGIFPDWDAANLMSVGLAERLGYVFDREYTVYQLALNEENFGE